MPKSFRARLDDPRVWGLGTGLVVFAALLVLALRALGGEVQTVDVVAAALTLVLLAAAGVAALRYQAPGRPPVLAAHVPGYAPTRVAALPRWVFLLGGGLGALGLLVLAAGHGQGGALAVCGLVLLGLGALGAGGAAASWGVARLTRRAQVRAIRAHLAQLQPSLAVLHSGGTGGSAYQLPMWLPYIEKVGEPYIVVTQDPKTVPVIAKVTQAPVICAGKADPALLKQVLVRSLKVAFYVRNTKLNRVFLKHRRITHVWLNHGDSDKPANFNPLHKEFDKLFVCGQLGVDRYAAHGVEIPRERFEIIGRPQVGDIELETRPIAEKTQPVVLYAPTWMGIHDYDNYTSLPIGAELVRRLLERDVRVIFRPHPLSRKPAEIDQVRAVEEVLREDKERTGRAHVWGKKAEQTWSVADCVNRSDALVSDVSSVVSDYLASLKPYALVAMNHTVEEFREQFASARSAYVVRRDLSNLDECLDQLLGEDPLLASRTERREYTLGGLTGQEAAEAFVRTVRRLMAERS